MVNIRKIENYFQNHGYEDIVTNVKIYGAHFTSLNVFGNEVIWLNTSDFQEVIQKRYKLKSYCVNVEVKEEDNIEEVKERIIHNISAKNCEMFGGITDREKLLDLTCNQLCEWQWLRYDDGKIFHKKLVNGNTIYSAILVKYAVVLDLNGNPVDPDIKEIVR